ncbi:MAG: phytanoyl-CoA dioxygenase family protein [Myxococcota bacterium]|jgi:hypothetical protein
MSAGGNSGRFAATPDELRRYGEDGFFVRSAVFAPAELEVLRQAVEKVVAEAGEHGGKTYEIDGNRYRDTEAATLQYEHHASAETIRVIEPFHHLHPDLDRLVDDPRMTEAICGILSCPAVALWTEKINCKRPFEGSGFRWHQDSPYWSHACSDVERLPNVMLTLDDADEENGCFRVIRGSHRNGFLPGLDDESQLGPLFTDPKHFDETAEYKAILPAGSQVFFSPHSVHGSQPNRSDRPRRALVLTYQPAGRRMFKIDATRNAGPEQRSSEIA